MVKIEQTPDTKTVVRELEGRRRKLVGPGRPSSGIPVFHKKASIMLDAWVQRNFKTEGGNLKDGRWEPLQAGGRWRRGFGIDTSAKILQDTGLLRASHQPFYSRRNAGIGTELPYSKYHNKGMGVPVRRTVPKDMEVRDALMSLLQSQAKAAT